MLSRWFKILQDFVRFCKILQDSGTSWDFCNNNDTEDNNKDVEMYEELNPVTRGMDGQQKVAEQNNTFGNDRQKPSMLTGGREANNF